MNSCKKDSIDTQAMNIKMIMFNANAVMNVVTFAETGDLSKRVMKPLWSLSSWRDRNWASDDVGGSCLN